MSGSTKIVANDYIVSDGRPLPIKLVGGVPATSLPASATFDSVSASAGVITTVTSTTGNITTVNSDTLNVDHISEKTANHSIVIEDNITQDGSTKFPTNAPGSFYTMFHNDLVATGIPGNDGFRVRWDNDCFGANNDGLIIEKIDANNTIPDGGIAFSNTGSGGVSSIAMAILGTGLVEMFASASVTGSISADGNYTDHLAERTAAHNIHVDSNLDARDDLYVAGNTTLNIDSGDKDFTVKANTAGNAVVYDAGSEAWYFDKNIVINNAHGDYDTTIKGDTDSNLIHVDASTDKVGIGVSAASSKLDINGDCEVASANAIYFGDPTTLGSWRVIRSGNNLLWQRYEDAQFEITGGTETTDGPEEIHTFTSDANMVVTGSGNVKILVVGGGGGGCVGGGGGGGVVYNAAQALSTGTYAIDIGTGGAGTVVGDGSARGNNGANTTVGVIITAAGGGGGGGVNATRAGGDGGSGGGGGAWSGGSSAGGDSTQGNHGGNGEQTADYAGGGGGGGSGLGQNATADTGGNGGTGYASTILDGSTDYYAGGGGAGGWGTVTYGTGTHGGGNAGGAGGSNGTANTGGGGGGTIQAQTGGTGGSGIVIVRYTPVAASNSWVVKDTMSA